MFEEKNNVCRKLNTNSYPSEKVKVAQSCLTICNLMDYSVHGILSQNTGMGSLSLLQGIFQPRVQTQVSRIAGGLFSN